MTKPKRKTSHPALRAPKRKPGRLIKMSKAEDRAVTSAAKTDPDNPPLGAALLARMRPVAKAAPELVTMARRRGRPKLDNPKQAIKLRLSPDVLTWFRATGRGWQTRIDAALRKVARLS